MVEFIIVETVFVLKGGGQVREMRTTEARSKSAKAAGGTLVGSRGQSLSTLGGRISATGDRYRTWHALS